MADFKYIDKNTIIELLQQYGINDIDIDAIYSDTSSNFVDYTKKLCKLYLKYLEEGSDNSLKMAYSLGGIIIFNLRKFVVKKDIIMLIGGTDAENNNLKVSKIPLTKLLNDPTNFKINDSSLSLHSFIEKYNNLNQNINRQQSAVWKKILDASELSGKGDFLTKKETNFSIKTKDGGERKLYQRLKKDTNVYYGYAGKNIYSYYDVGNWYQYFNRGWLFEHFMSKWAKATNIMREDMITESKGDHPVAIAIDKTDNIPGYKGGDFQVRGRDYQAKYGNQQIITKISIQEVMSNIIKLLDQYEINKKGAKKRISEELVHLFTDEGNIEEQVNKSYDEKVNQLVNSLVRRI